MMKDANKISRRLDEEQYSRGAKKINKMLMKVDMFWDSVRRDAECIKHSERLILERNIYLEDDDRNECANVIIIGLNPHNEFNVCARIELRTISGTTNLRLDANTLNDLLDHVEDRFCENTVVPKYSGIINIQQINERIYRVRIGKENIKIHLDTLLAMREKRQIVKSHIKLFERDDFKSKLYNLLDHFCFQAKEQIVLQTLHPSNKMKKKELALELCALNCTCLDKEFVLEITSNCLEWFVTTVPNFINTLIRSQ